MSLVTICTNVALDCGIDLPPGPIFGSRAPASQRLLMQAKRAAKSLFNEVAWTFLTVEHVFTAAGSNSSDFMLPPDFDRLVHDTLWERTRYWSLRGAMSPQQWQAYRSSIYGRATIERRWRIRIPSGQGAGAPVAFSVDPQLGGTDTTTTFVFEYVSANWCQAANGMMQPDWGADTDSALLDEYLVELGTRWRVLRRLGLAYDEEQDEYNRQLDQAIARDGGTATLSLVPSSRTVFIGPYNVPDTGFGPVPP
jgi:hypothetical protein